KTLPRTEGIHSRGGERIKDFKELVEGDVEDEALVSRKRKAPASKADGAASKEKRAKTGGAMDVATMRAKAEEGKLSSYTIAQLTAFLQSVDQKAAKKKGDLIQQIQDYFAV
ncbi:hypothetical protein HK104_006334, partial [Borealophlyctis nickersoniae]